MLGKLPGWFAPKWIVVINLQPNLSLGASNRTAIFLSISAFIMQILLVLF